MKFKPQFLLFAFPAALAAAYGAYRIQSAAGDIDWENGRIHARGEVPLKNGADAAARQSAERAATLIAQRNALALCKGINIDGETAMGDDPEVIKKIWLQGTLVGGVVGPAKIQNGKLLIEVEAPLYGAQGIATAIVTDFRSRYLPPPAAKEDYGPSPNQAPVLLVDARGTGANPALFPKIKQDDGTPVYTAANRDEQELLSGGQVKYVTAPQSSSHHAAHPFRLLLIGNPPPRPVPPDVPLLRAARAEGKTRADLALAPGEEKKLERPEVRDALRRGNVLIVMDDSVGGIEGRRFAPLPSEYAALLMPRTHQDKE